MKYAIRLASRSGRRRNGLSAGVARRARSDWPPPVPVVSPVSHELLGAEVTFVRRLIKELGVIERVDPSSRPDECSTSITPGSGRDLQHLETGICVAADTLLSPLFMCKIWRRLLRWPRAGRDSHRVRSSGGMNTCSRLLPLPNDFSSTSGPAARAGSRASNTTTPYAGSTKRTLLATARGLTLRAHARCLRLPQCRLPAPVHPSPDLPSIPSATTLRRDIACCNSIA